MSKVLQQPVSSTSTRLSSLTSTDQISQALFIKPLPIEEKFSEKVNNCLNFTSDPSLLPNSSSYIPNIKQLSERESKDALANNSNYITVGNLPKANSNENKLSNENHTNPTQTSFGVSLNEIVNRLSVQSHQLGMERFRRSVSPIFKKYEFLEKDKENIQNSAFKGGAVQNESFGVPHSLAKETKSNLPSSFGSGNTLLKSAKKETGSSGNEV